MSHVAECKLVIKSLDAMEKAACRLGGELRRGVSKARMFSSGFVDDSTGWTEFFSPEEAARIAKLDTQSRRKIINEAMSSFDHVISFTGAKYDVGVKQVEDGTYRLRYDEWGEGGLQRIMGPGGGKFKQAYAIEAAKKAIKARGYACKETVNKQGRVQLEVLVN
jgi:hypothetical protein